MTHPQARSPPIPFLAHVHAQLDMAPATGYAEANSPIAKVMNSKAKPAMGHMMRIILDMHDGVSHDRICPTKDSALGLTVVLRN